jgi:hypothetical protein
MANRQLDVVDKLWFKRILETTNFQTDPLHQLALWQAGHEFSVLTFYASLIESVIFVIFTIHH